MNEYEEMVFLDSFEDELEKIALSKELLIRAREAALKASRRRDPMSRGAFSFRRHRKGSQFRKFDAELRRRGWKPDAPPVDLRKAVENSRRQRGRNFWGKGNVTRITSIPVGPSRITT
ncbi:MAG: hypothetical protein GWO24_02560 [Akkermansiaceae bacterium]|nr:hypothetical protein [Akkermansiaceae bacterium]